MYDACAIPIFPLQMQVDHLALEMMSRGILIDASALVRLAGEVDAEKSARFTIILKWLPEATEKLPNSPKQMRELFEKLGLKPGVNRKTHRPTYDNEVLWSRCKSHPKLAPLLRAIMEWRTLDKMESNYIAARRDPDGRMRCSFNTTQITNRWSSSANPWYRGTNLQNVAKPFHNLTGCPLPNLRTSIIPDPGYVFWEPDLKGADAQIVAWDSGDPVMKEVFKKGLKLHAIRAKEIYGAAAGPDGKTEPYYTLAKKGGHLWNYAGKARTMAASLGILVVEAEKIVKRLAGLHPFVPRWHDRIKADVDRDRSVRNAFGYRIIYLGRTSDVLPDALAWIGQGTVACIANRVALNIENNVPNAELILQEHDSLVGQTKIELWEATAPQIREQFLRVVVPYPEPLVIAPSVKTSEKSWGDMKEDEWA